ncbi:MAG: response regulator transcription factor [Muribaculaceae bacterium]
MDVLRRELDAIYARQQLCPDTLPASVLQHAIDEVKAMTSVLGCCAVITDAACDRSYFFGGRVADLLELPSSHSTYLEIDSSDEDFLYARIHPKDIVDKRMLEYEFLKYADRLTPRHKTSVRAVCRLRISDAHGRYFTVDNSTRVLKLSPSGKIWLILCCYDLSALEPDPAGICAGIVDVNGGMVEALSFADKRAAILSDREKQILNLIRAGKLSKEIADVLSISVNTVSRHRQNILQKLSVGNSMEAVNAAIAMGLL